MKRGRSVTRETKLRRLRLQGMDYDAEQKFFYCRYCRLDIYSVDLAKAKRHVESDRHKRFSTIAAGFE